MSHKRKETAKQWFESDLEAKEIRDACLLIIQVLFSLLNDERVGVEAELRERLLTSIEPLEGQLISKEIVPDMNVGASQWEYASSPLFTVQWIAGQLRSFLEKNPLNIVDILPSLAAGNEVPGQKDENEDDSLAIVKMPDESEPLYAFIFARIMLNNFVYLLGAEDEVGHRDWLPV